MHFYEATSKKKMGGCPLALYFLPSRTTSPERERGREHFTSQVENRRVRGRGGDNYDRGNFFSHLFTCGECVT